VLFQLLVFFSELGMEPKHLCMLGKYCIMSYFSFSFSFFVVLGFELRASCLLGRRSVT
jgi:hypothetical protein